MAKKRRRRTENLVGTTLQGRYQLVRLLGDGGMGAVYKAADQVLRRFVAIKLLHPSTAEKSSSVERFVREARSAAAIGHPNIIDILDFGYENNRPFLVMEYLKGRSLSEALREEGPLPVDRACRIATHALAGLQAAHDQGILHRDLKPANLMLIAMLGDKDFVKLCDFGFAALTQPTARIDDGKSLTPARTLVGTPAYAAPERLRGDDTGRDPRADVYSIGVVLYETLAGRRPFDAPTFKELARAIRKEPPRPIRELRAGLPRGLPEVIHKALEKRPDSRWSSSEELAAALVPFGGRVVQRGYADDLPSDTFTMDLLRIRARETHARQALDQDEAEEVVERSKRGSRRPPAQRYGLEPTEGLPAAKKKERAKKPARGFPDLPNVALTDHGTQSSIGGSRPGRIDPNLVVKVNWDDDEGMKTVVDEPRVWAGSVSTSVLRFVARRFGERKLKDVLNALAPGPKSVFEAGVGANDWVPYEAHNALVQTVDAVLGRDDLHLVVQCGRAAAEGAFELMRSIDPPAPTPISLLSRMPMVVGALLRGTILDVERVGHGHGRLGLDEKGEPSLPANVFLIGFFDRSLDRFGAREVEVNLLHSRALGDEQTVYEVSWLA